MWLADEEVPRAIGARCSSRTCWKPGQWSCRTGQDCGQPVLPSFLAFPPLDSCFIGGRHNWDFYERVYNYLPQSLTHRKYSVNRTSDPILRARTSVLGAGGRNCNGTGHSADGARHRSEPSSRQCAALARWLCPGSFWEMCNWLHLSAQLGASWL